MTSLPLGNRERCPDCNFYVCICADKRKRRLFKVQVSGTWDGHHMIEADTPEEAKAKAQDMPVPGHVDYTDYKVDGQETDDQLPESIADDGSIAVKSLPRVSIKGPLGQGRIVLTLDGGVVQAVDFPPKGTRLRGIEIWDFDVDGTPDADLVGGAVNTSGERFSRQVYKRP